MTRDIQAQSSLVALFVLKVAMCTASGLQRAIEKAGSQEKLARLLGISQQAVQQWHQVPAGQIIAIERVTGVPREDLRPDLYRRLPRP